MLLRVSIGSITNLGGIGGALLGQFATSTLDSALKAGNFAGAAAILQAAADLSVVQDVIDAIHVSDVASGKQFGPAGIAVNPPQPGEAPNHCQCPVVHPSPIYAFRPTIHPAPQYAPRPVIHPAPRTDLDESSQCAPCKPPCAFKLDIQPPWKVLPWPQPAKPIVKIKHIIRPTDTTSKGSLIDLFV